MTHTAMAAALLPQMTAAKPFVTDGGLETVLVFHDGRDLPLFAAFPLLQSDEGRQRLDRYLEDYLHIARRHGTGFVIETPTWRASRDWTAQLGLGPEETAELNARAIRLGRDYAGRHPDVPIVVSGQIGPRGDGYAPASQMTAAEAEDYHAHQVGAFAGAGADAVTALTMTHMGEATGVARAARAAGVPAVISFTVETDGRLPSGQTLGEAIEQTDAESGHYPVYFGINCAHPDHFLPVLEAGGDWLERVGMIRANASRLSHAELDCAEELDAGDPRELGQLYARLRSLLPSLRVMGGCCGTDHRHVHEIAGACLH